MMTLVVFQQIRYNEAFDITNPWYNEPIGTVPGTLLIEVLLCEGTSTLYLGHLHEDNTSFNGTQISLLFKIKPERKI